MTSIPDCTVNDTCRHDFNTTQDTSGPFRSEPHWSLKRFFRGQPKALGVVQIMIGLMHVFFGPHNHEFPIVILLTSIPALFFIISGSCSVAAENKLTRLRVKCSLGWSIVSCCMALYEIIIIVGYSIVSQGRGNLTDPITVMVINSFFTTLIILEFFIALSTSVCGCKTLCYDPNEDLSDLPMRAIPASLSEPPYEVLTSRPQEYATLQLP